MDNESIKHTVILRSNDSKNASSFARSCKIDSSVDRLINMCSAFFAIGYHLTSILIVTVYKSRLYVQHSP